jgi:hypothetical protein
MNDLDDLRATYGKEAQFSEHKRGEHIHYLTAEGLRSSGTIIWVQEWFQSIQSIGVKYVVAPDDPNGFLDFVIPGDVLQVEDITQEHEPTLVRCIWGMARIRPWSSHLYHWSLFYQ